MLNKHDVIPGARYHLNGDLVEVISINDGRIFMRGVIHKSPVYLPGTEVDQLLRQARLVPVSNALLDERKALQLVRADAAEVLKLDRAVYYVRRLLAMFNGALPREKTLAAVQKMAAELGDPTPPKYTKLYMLMKRYMGNGQNMFALMDASSGKQLRTKRLCQESLSVMQDYIRNYYLKGTSPPGAMVYKLFVSHIEELNRQSEIKLDIPSASTFYRALGALDKYEAAVARKGRKAANKLHAFGIGIHCPDRLLSRVEADTQEVDVQLVGEDGLYLGRPYLTVLVEVLTGAVIGWSLSFTPPCFEKTASALRHALTERADGSPAGLMEELVVDNGAEFYNASFLWIAKRLGFTVRFCAAGQPNQKPFVESFFRTLNVQLIHGLDGTTKSNPQMRGDYDSEGEAVMTLDELRNVVEDWIQNYYNQTPHGQRRLPPSELWKRYLDLMNPPQAFTEQAVSFICMATQLCTINRGRVRFKNLAWTGPALGVIQSKLKAGQKVQVLYDRTDLGSAYVRDPVTEIFHQVDAVQEYQYGLSMYEHDLVQQKLKEDAAGFTGEGARQALLRIWKLTRESRKNNERRKQAHLRDLRDAQVPRAQPGETIAHVPFMGDDIQTPEEIDFGLIDQASEDPDTEYQTFQLPSKK